VAFNPKASAYFRITLCIKGFVFGKKDMTVSPLYEKTSIENIIVECFLEQE